MVRIPQSSAYSSTSGYRGSYSGTNRISGSTGTPIGSSQPASVRGPAGVAGPAGPAGPASSVVVHDDLSNKANGTPTTFDSGQPYDFGGAGTLLPVSPTIISNGALTLTKPATGGWATYPEAVLNQNVNRIGAEFFFEPGATTYTGCICLVIWSGGSYVANSSSTPAHFIVGQTTWQFYVKPAKGNSTLNLIAQGNFPKLTDNKVYRTDCYLLNGQAILILPTGEIVVVTDSSIATAQALGYSTPCWEPYAQANTDARVFIRRLWADAVDPATVPTGGGVSLAQVADVVGRVEARRAASTPTVVEYNATGTYTLTTTATNLDATNLAITFTTGPSGNVILSVEGILKMTATDIVVLGFNVNGGDYMSVVNTNDNNAVTNGRVTATRKVLLAPNTQYTATVKGNRFNASGSTGTVSFATGGAYAPTIMRATPCQ